MFMDQNYEFKCCRITCFGGCFTLYMYTIYDRILLDILCIIAAAHALYLQEQLQMNLNMEQIYYVMKIFGQ